MGLPFKNAFAELIYGATDIALSKYDKSLFTEEVIPHDYELPKFENDHIIFKKETKLFLETFCCSHKRFYNIFCGFSRILLSAKTEGRKYQTCLWISGPPGTMKSTWPNVLKLLVAKSRVQEQSKQITPFTADQLQIVIC